MNEERMMVKDQMHKNRARAFEDYVKEVAKSIMGGYLQKEEVTMSTLDRDIDMLN